MPLAFEIIEVRYSGSIERDTIIEKPAIDRCSLRQLLIQPGGRLRLWFSFDDGNRVKLKLVPEALAMLTDDSISNDQRCGHGSSGTES